MIFLHQPQRKDIRVALCVQSKISRRYAPHTVVGCSMCRTSVFRSAVRGCEAFNSAIGWPGYQRWEKERLLKEGILRAASVVPRLSQRSRLKLFNTGCWLSGRESAADNAMHLVWYVSKSLKNDGRRTDWWTLSETEIDYAYMIYSMCSAWSPSSHAIPVNPANDKPQCIS